MKFIKVTLLALMGMLTCSVSMQAQSCMELYKRAQSLKNSKNYAEAITYYLKAKDCDAELTTDCNKGIKYCEDRLKLAISETEVKIPYQGGDRQIVVDSYGDWKVEGTTDWCNTNVYDNKNFVVECRDVYNGTIDKIATLLVKSGSIYKSLKVIQEGRPAYVEVGAESLSFPPEGTMEEIKIESNVNWDVTSVPSWCKVDKKEDGIRIVVSANERVTERVDDIVIITPSNKKVTIKIQQGAGEEHLTLSHNNLVLGNEGDVHYLRVYTDADNWFVGDFPTWLNVRPIGKDSIRIECGRNIPNGEPRTGSVQVRTDRQTAGVMVTQAPLPPQNLIFLDSRLIGGRNFSLGFSASYYMPFVGTSAGGDYVGSVLDYGLGNSSENASYKSAIGYSFGVFADVRLYKNIFLMAGVNFTQMKYKNEFNQNTIYTMPYTAYEYMKGEVQNSYKEEYSHTMLEIPLLASYRFKVNDVSHLQLNVGPVLNFGLSAKMKLSGNTDSETIKKYNSFTHQQSDNSNYLRHTAVNAEFNLYQPCVYWEEMYTTGNDAPVPHHDTFQESPLKKFNCGLRIGTAYEWAGLSFGISYTHMLTNMANKNYWENERWTVLNVSDQTMKGYKHRLNTLEFKLAYTLRYLKTKKIK